MGASDNFFGYSSNFGMATPLLLRSVSRTKGKNFMNEQNTNQQPNRIPDFSSIEEEAAFWDTHDTTDFEEEFHPVTVHFDEHLSEYHLSKKLEVSFDE